MDPPPQTLQVHGGERGRVGRAWLMARVAPAQLAGRSRAFGEVEGGERSGWVGAGPFLIQQGSVETKRKRCTRKILSGCPFGLHERKNAGAEPAVAIFVKTAHPSGVFLCGARSPLGSKRHLSNMPEQDLRPERKGFGGWLSRARPWRHGDATRKVASYHGAIATDSTVTPAQHSPAVTGRKSSGGPRTPAWCSHVPFRPPNTWRPPLSPLGRSTRGALLGRSARGAPLRHGQCRLSYHPRRFSNGGWFCFPCFT